MSSLHQSKYLLLLLFSYLFIAAVSSSQGSYVFYKHLDYPRDCKEVYAQCSSKNSSGIYTIKPDGYTKPFEVYCNNQIAPGGWTVIQRQIDGSLTFKRTWEDYRNGFGFLSNEFYVGNDKLSYLTNQAVCELRIDMTLVNGSHFYVKYNSFRISDEWREYAIVKAEGFSGNSSCAVTNCPVGMRHGGCACQTLCSDPVEMTNCGEMCVESCVPKRCFVNESNSYISEGETYTSSDCSKKCSCTNGQLTCNNTYRCDPNAVCERRSNDYQCSCNAGYSGDGVNCVSICRENEVFGLCSCQRSCTNPTACEPCNLSENCHCPNGFYLQGGDCVRQEECSCFTDGAIIPKGETYVNSDCSKRCTCNNDQLDCNTNYRCSPNAACRVESGVRQCYCNSGYDGDGVTCTFQQVYTDCNDVQDAGITQSGVYSIRPAGYGSSFDVFCNMTIDGGGWTVFQRRINGATDFYRNWADYKNGFGNIQQEFWLGNEKLYYLTQQAWYEYRFDYVMSTYSSRYQKYTRFRVGSESNNYRVTHVGSVSGNGGFSLRSTQNLAFSTYDRDNDGRSYTNCAVRHRSGWWHGSIHYADYHYQCFTFREGSLWRLCSYANPNGDYNGGDGQNIVPYRTVDCNSKYTEIKVRRT